MRILVFRMSSMGDVLLSTAFLENLPASAQVDWVIAREFEFVLKGHPKIRRLIAFDRAKGLRGWWQLIRALSREQYDHRVDLHRTLRTGLAFFYFRFAGSGRLLRISKERIRTLTLLALRKHAFSSFFPTPYWIRFGRMAKKIAGTRSRDALLPPSYLPILEASGLEDSTVLREYGLTEGGYFCVMPASRWVTKEWGADRFFEAIHLLRDRGLEPLILGRERDPACARLKELLTAANLPFREALREPNFLKTAVLLKHSAFYLGCDTGLSHLAESVGCPAHVVFGPTQPELGFGPIRAKSRAISYGMGCSPCSKDGRVCRRFFDPYACMKRLSAEDAVRFIPGARP